MLKGCAALTQPAALLSVAVTENEETPGVVGVPEISPVEVFKLSPAGNDPLASANVYGPVPPLAASVCKYALFWVAFGSEVVVTVVLQTSK